MADFFSLKTHYRGKTPFWTAQQRDCFDLSYDRPTYAIIHEPRCGKSKIIVDTCCYQFHVPTSPLKIRGAFIAAWPNGGHSGWVLDAFPESFMGPWKGFTWDNDDAMTKTKRREFEALLKFDGFAVMAVGADTLISEKLKADIGRFLMERGSVMIVGDESSFMITPTALRSKIMHKISHDPACRRFVRMRRILDGTPCDAAGPLDFYNQMGFLDWNILGYPNQVEYDRHYAEIVTKGRAPFWAKVRDIVEAAVRVRNPGLDAHGVKVEASERLRESVVKEWAIEKAKKEKIEDNGVIRRVKRGRDWWSVVDEDSNGLPKFKNMDEFWARMDKHSHRATFAACFPNARRPVYRKHEFELTPEQRRVYLEMEDEHVATLSDMTEIEAAHHLARILRLQQIGSNYFPEKDIINLHLACSGMGCEACDDTGIVESVQPLKLIDHERNPRMDALRAELDQRPTIIWARFKQDVDQAMKVCASMGFKVCQYDGRISRKQKLANRLGFQAGEFDKIVGNPAAASRAIPLYRGERHIMVSNIYSFRTRRQMEERAEHGRKELETEIVDLVALNTVDDISILPALRAGMDVSTYTLRDAKRKWI